MTKKNQAVLEAQAKALRSENRSLKAALKRTQAALDTFIKCAGDDAAEAEVVAHKLRTEIDAQAIEIARQADILRDKGYVPLPEHALRAMDEPKVEAPRNVMRMAEEYRG